MTRIGCRAHDYGKLPAVALAATLRAKGYNAAQLAMPRAIAGIEDFAHITDKQLAEIRTAFAAQDVEISVLSCYQDLSAPDADARRTAVDAVKRTLGYAKMLGAKMVGSETAWGACTDEEKAAHWSRWLEVIGDQLGAVHVKDCRIEADGSKTLLPLGAGDMDYSAIRAFLATHAPAAPLLRDEVILPADTADVRYLRRMTDTV